MSSLVASAFAEFLRRLELNPTRRALASQRYNAVKEVIEDNLSGATVRQIGSFQRQTKIRPVDLSDQLDVDGLVVIGDAHRFVAPHEGLTPEGAMARVVRALRRSVVYRVMDPAADAPAILLEYADGFKMELAVGYRDFTGTRTRPNGPPSYLVSGPGGVWLPADYDWDAQVVTMLNQSAALGETLVPTIKAFKHLVRAAQVPLKSFHIEIIAALALPEAARHWNAQQLPWNVHHAVARVLCDAGALLGRPVALPGSFSPPLDSGLSTEAASRVGTFLHNLGDRMWALFGLADDQRAVAALRDLLGDPFPPLAAVG